MTTAAAVSRHGERRQEASAEGVDGRSRHSMLLESCDSMRTPRLRDARLFCRLRGPLFHACYKAAAAMRPLAACAPPRNKMLCGTSLVRNKRSKKGPMVSRGLARCSSDGIKKLGADTVAAGSSPFNRTVVACDGKAGRLHFVSIIDTASCGPTAAPACPPAGPCVRPHQHAPRQSSRLRPRAAARPRAP
jgi:hypothetical protein